MKTVSELKHKCLRCGAQWIGRIATRPVRCPRCQSPAWDKPKKQS